MRRKDREMNREFALTVLDKCDYAVLSMADAETGPYCLPVTIVRSGDALYFHCAPEGRKADLLRRSGRICLAAVGDAHIPPNEFTTEYESAVVFGACAEVTDEAEKVEALRLLCQRHVPAHMDAFEREAARSLHRTGVWRIDMETVTGKRKKCDSSGKS